MCMFIVLVLVFCHNYVTIRTIIIICSYIVIIIVLASHGFFTLGLNRVFPKKIPINYYFCIVKFCILYCFVIINNN